MDNCAACVFADLLPNKFLIEDWSKVEMINNHIIKMRCNNVHYQNPTIHFPPEICSDLYISDDCHPEYRVGIMPTNRTKTETDRQN